MACCVLIAAFVAALLSLVTWLTGRRRPPPTAWRLAPPACEVEPPAEAPRP